MRVASVFSIEMMESLFGTYVKVRIKKLLKDICWPFKVRSQSISSLGHSLLELLAMTGVNSDTRFNVLLFFDK